ncbi:MATE family efflux transporter [Feifania hominis]|uniref:MATE family efflux transporter n=1 Tax=Feifania hominis TaxID=2763660 RepID=UPI003211B276
MKIAKLFEAQDVTTGTPWLRITQLTVPMLLGNIAQQLYNTVDTIVVGRYVGDNALAAVGGASPILNLLLVLFIGISTGAGILVSQRFGAHDREGLARVIGNCITVTAIATVISMAIGVLAARPLLRLMHTPPAVYEWCADYLTIFFLGIAGFVYYNILSGILRGLGDNVSALLFLLVSTAINIVLDLWFVAGFGMGVAGVALATVIAQGISAVLCTWKLFRMRKHFHLKKSDLRLDASCVRGIIGLGLPSGVSQGVFSISALLVQSLTNSLGEIVMACNVVVMRIDGFAMMPAFSIGVAMTTYAGQNYGAGQTRRLRDGARQGILVALVMSAVLTGGILLFGEQLAWIFTDTQALIGMSVQMLRILAVGYLVFGVSQALSGFMRGIGDTRTPMWIAIITQVVLRLPLAYLFAWLSRDAEYPNGRPESLFASLVISWTIAAVLTVAAYRRKVRKLMKGVAQVQGAQA